MQPNQPFRGDVWDAEFDVGQHPAVVLSNNSANVPLGHVAMVVITGTSGPASTHVPLTRDAGLTGYDESYADITTLQPVDKYDVLQQRGRLTLGELAQIEDRLRVYLGL